MHPPKLKNFYLKKIGQRGEIDVWMVDGAKIRKKIEKDFTNFGQHFRFPFIPLNEFWLDKEAVPNERYFFVEHLLVEWRLMKAGKSYSFALRRADRREKSERKKAGDIRGASIRRIAAQKKAKVRLFSKTAGGISVFIVRGRLARSIFDIDFTEGGHDLVYDYVPKNEVWIDNDVLARERPYIILHELYERDLMKKGLGYSSAHKKASRIEWRARRSVDFLEKNLEKLGWSK